MIAVDGISTTVAVLGVVAGLIGIAGFIGALIAYARFKGLESSMELMRSANGELRAELMDEREKRAKLEGQIEVLVGSLADKIVAAVALRVSEMRWRPTDSRTRSTDS